MKYIFIMVAIFAGMTLPLQAVLIAKMAKAIGNPIYASFISFVTGSLVVLVFLLMTKVNLSIITQATNLHWSVWFAGVLGAFYVCTVIILTPQLGATLTFALVIAGQLSIAVVLDHYGWFGLPVHVFNWSRIAGLLLITAGVVLIRNF